MSKFWSYFSKKRRDNVKKENELAALPVTTPTTRTSDDASTLSTASGKQTNTMPELRHERAESPVNEKQELQETKKQLKGVEQKKKETVPAPRVTSLASPAVTDELHFIILQHGYHGGKMDLQYLADCLLAGAPSHTHILHSVLPYFKTDYGVRYGATHLVTYIADEVQRLVTIQREVNKRVRETVNTATAPADTESSDSTNKDEDDETEPPLLHLHFSFVAHSMGGLIVRAALPALAEELQRRPLAPITVHWDTLCCISVPHVGTVHMPHKGRALFGGSISRFSQSLSDLFLRSPVVTEELLTPEYLQALQAFQQRVILHACNDQTVMSHTAALHISPEDQKVLTGVLKDYPPTVDTEAREAQGLPPVGTSLDTMAASRWTLQGLTETLWPSALLPRERAMADTLLAGGLAPVDVHTVDLRPAAAKATNLFGWMWKRLWANTLAHRGIICEPPCHYPSAFGFVSEYVCTEVLQVPLEEEKVRVLMKHH